MGGGRADALQAGMAYRLGKRIAAEGGVLISGGRYFRCHGGFGPGGLRTARTRRGHPARCGYPQHAPYSQIPILTGMGSARNTINALSSRVMVACPGGAGTLSEIARALKHRRAVVLMGMAVGDLFAAYQAEGRLKKVTTPEEVIAAIKSYL